MIFENDALASCLSQGEQGYQMSQPKEIEAQIHLEDQTDCPVCGSAAGERCFEVWDDRYAFPEIFGLRQCLDCRSFYLDKYIATESLDKLYSQYYPKISLRDLGRRISPLRLLIFNILNIGPLARGFNFRGFQVLDIGCGSGGSESVIQQSGGKWVGLDVNPECVQAFERRGFPCLYGTPESICDAPGSRYDMILASQVIEHSHAPGDFLKACHKLLKPTGTMVLSTPNADSRFRKRYALNWINWHCPYHPVIFSPSGLKSLAESSGFSVRSLETTTPATWFVYQKNYQRPAMGRQGQWYNKQIPLGRLLHSGIMARMGDFFFNDGDMMTAVLQKG